MQRCYDHGPWCIYLVDVVADTIWHVPSLLPAPSWQVHFVIHVMAPRMHQAAGGGGGWSKGQPAS